MSFTPLELGLSAEAKEKHAVAFRYEGSATWFNTWDNLHMIPETRPSIVPPSLKTNYIDIPGGDGSFDATSSLWGYPNYNMREGSIVFIVLSDWHHDSGYENWANKYNSLVQLFHGKEMYMALCNDNGYFKGRITLGEWTTNETYSTITLNYNLYPYKYISPFRERIYENTILPNTYNYVAFSTPDIPYYPEFTVTANAQLRIWYDCSGDIDGEHQIDDMTKYVDISGGTTGVSNKKLYRIRIPMVSMIAMSDLAGVSPLVTMYRDCISI